MRRRTEEEDEEDGNNSSDVCLALGVLFSCILECRNVVCVNQDALLNLFECSMPCRKRKKG